MPVTQVYFIVQFTALYNLRTKHQNKHDFSLKTVPNEEQIWAIFQNNLSGVSEIF